MVHFRVQQSAVEIGNQGVCCPVCLFCFVSKGLEDGRKHSMPIDKLLSDLFFEFVNVFVGGLVTAENGEDTIRLTMFHIA